MRNLAFLVLIISLSLTTFAQSQKSNFGKDSKTKVTETPKLGDEQEEFQKAISESDAANRVSALKTFVENFPKSEQKNRALGLIVSGRAELADKKLKENETEVGIKLFKLAVEEAPTPISDRLYAGIILQIPNNLFFRGERVAGMEVAALIEKKVADDPNQLLALSNFYLGVENAPAAVRVAENVIKLNPKTKGVYQALGLAHRFNFNLEKSAEAYAEAVEADKESISTNESIATKNSLAEMKRATGKFTEAIALYNEILASDPTNLSARTGLILSQFDAGKVDEADLAMSNFLVDEPNNLFLLVGAAYWYAAKGNGERAINLSRKALDIEPRYTWAYIALARGLLKNGDPVEAEKVLLIARKYGNFPTLQYEIASSRLAAGFYKDALDELKQSFTVKDGVIKTKLGGRFEIESDNFTNLLSLERQAGIFQTNAADNAEDAERLKKLLKFGQNLESKEPGETEIVESADEFMSGDDKMKTHRQIFVADQLLAKKVALPKVLEITKDATKGVDNALDVVNPSAAVLADELYEPRRSAMLKGEFLVVPNLPRQTLTSILRGRIEEISGWALFRQEERVEATVRLKRAISVLPKDSVWMRSTMWRMGDVLASQGKSNEALDYYIKGYSFEENSDAKKLVIEKLYTEINGNLDGLKERLESKPIETNTNAIFIKKGESNTAKTEPKEETPVNEKSANRNENPVNTNRTTLRIPDVVPIKRDSPKPNVEKLPEDINLNILDTTKVQTTPQATPETIETVMQPTPEIIETEVLPTPQPIEMTIDESLENKDEVDEDLQIVDESTVEIATNKPNEGINSNETDVQHLDDPKVETTNETKSDDPVVETQSVETKVEDQPTSKKIRRHLVIINDGLSNTRTEIDPTLNTEIKKIGSDQPPTTEVKSDQPPANTVATETKKSDVEPTPLENTEVDKPNTEQENISTEIVSEVVSDDENKRSDERTADNNLDEKTSDDKKEENISTGATRMRVVSEEKLRNSEGEKEKIEPCGIMVSQDEVAIINNGGSLGILIGVEKESANTDIKAVSSSPEDVEAVFEPEIGAVQGRAFFVIRSISTNQGEYKITFDTPCGKKEITVKVR